MVEGQIVEIMPTYLHLRHQITLPEEDRIIAMPEEDIKTSLILQKQTINNLQGILEELKEEYAKHV